MNKRLIITLAAGLLLLSVASCTNTKTPGGDTTSTDPSDTGNYIVIPGTDENGNDVTRIEYVTGDPDDTAPDISEQNPTFTDCTKKIVVFTGVATVRTSTILADNNAVGWPKEGRILDVTGESENWYRIKYTVNNEEQICYIAKTVAADAAVLDTFTAIEEEEVIISEGSVNVRSYPSTASDKSIRGYLKEGDKVTRVAVSENWSRILFEVESESETDADGKPVRQIMQYYISNDCILSTETDTTQAADATSDTTAAAN